MSPSAKSHHILSPSTTPERDASAESAFSSSSLVSLLELDELFVRDDVDDDEVLFELPLYEVVVFAYATGCDDATVPPSGAVSFNVSCSLATK